MIYYTQRGDRIKAMRGNLPLSTTGVCIFTCVSIWNIDRDVAMGTGITDEGVGEYATKVVGLR